MNYLAFIPTLMPLAYMLYLNKNRAAQLAYQGAMFSNAVARAPKTGKNEARHVQAIRAMADKTPFVKMGLSMGLLSDSGDSFGADKGLPMGQTSFDLSTHLGVFGSTGAGKTTLLRTIFKAVCESNSGVLMLDGKGFLAKDCSKKLDFVIDHTTPMNLLENMEPEIFASTLQQMNEPEGGQQGNGKFFSDSARQGIFATMVIHQAACASGLYANNLDSFKGLLDLFFRSDDEAVLTMRLTLADINMREKVRQLYQDAVSYYQSMVLMEGETKQNIKSSIDAWLSPFFTSEKLRAWCSCVTSSVNVNDAMKGKRIGVCLPESEFPIAGKIATALLKRNFYREIQNRGDKLVDGHTKVFLFIDEAQVVVDSSDLTIVPLARSLNLSCVFATQNIESYIAKFGEQKALVMLDSLGSFVSLRSSDNTYEYLRKRIGKNRIWIENSQSQSISYGLTTKLNLANPVFDPTNPMRGWLKLHSFGVVKSMVSRLTLGSSGAQSGPGKYATMTLTPEPVFLLQEKDLEVIRTEPFTAIGVFQRAGVPRRDVMKTIPLDSDFKEIPVTVEQMLLKKSVDFGEAV